MSNITEDQNIDRIRGKLTQIGRSSHTTVKFQDDLIEFIERNSFNGFSLIEVGCYMGGLTAQLAYVAKKLLLTFDVIDIDHHFINIATDTVNQVGLADAVRFNAMDLTTFARSSPGYRKPALVFVDGDHRYDGVVADIRAIRSFTTLPYACAFHDFSLRYADGALTNVRVDRAIYDEFGPQVALTPIGETAGHGVLRTEAGEDRHFHERDQPEGVIIVIG
jgi:hypothetical protein